MEAFQFVKHPFVFIHCHVVICDASDSQSRCARGCVPSPRRERRGIEEKRVYSLVQGPLTIDDSSEEFEPSNDETAQNPPEIEVEVNMPIVATVAAATAFTVFGVVFVALRSRPHQN
ncbi:oncoprotein-induced transcript 3 protein-like [Pocillopora damicornis]|uniref:oncoprotein-induced transcript 3 protein-like n=1 Tax=Pocillopora damicornis TaxID=46731 RepID=UPI000F54D514|nr:oncoprotein-induced transcript 3 protein-like [Pocillopora damicornis]